MSVPAAPRPVLTVLAMKKTSPPPFVKRQRPGWVTAGDVIGVGGREASVLSVQKDNQPLASGHQVWAIDDRGEAVLAEWGGNAWKDRL